MTIGIVPAVLLLLCFMFLAIGQAPQTRWAGFAAFFLVAAFSVGAWENRHVWLADRPASVEMSIR
jgi:hypothetical protein